MNAYELRREYLKANPTGHFFDRDTMRFFGDTMRNFGVRTLRGLDAWVLYRKSPAVGHLDPSGNMSSTHVTLFDMRTLEPQTMTVSELNALACK